MYKQIKILSSKQSQHCILTTVDIELPYGVMDSLLKPPNMKPVQERPAGRSISKRFLRWVLVTYMPQGGTKLTLDCLSTLVMNSIHFTERLYNTLHFTTLQFTTLCYTALQDTALF